MTRKHIFNAEDVLGRDYVKPPNTWDNMEYTLEKRRKRKDMAIKRSKSKEEVKE